MMKPDDHASLQPWWGEYILAANTMARWYVGPLVLWAQRLEKEWRIAWRSDEELMRPVAQVEMPLPVEKPADGMAACRFSFRETGKPLRLVPASADRSMVVRPEMPLYIPGGEEITLFVSTPLWVQVFVGHSSTPLVELPTLRPSDTWFGPDTRHGEMCYASRTLAQLRVEDIVPRPHRAVTPVHIHNHGSDTLAVERLSVPMPLLSLSVNERGHFWTQSVTLERRTHREEATLQLGDMSLPGAAQVQRVGGPRQMQEDKTVLRALSRFFG